MILYTYTVIEDTDMQNMTICIWNRDICIPNKDIYIIKIQLSVF